MAANAGCCGFFTVLAIAYVLVFVLSIRQLHPSRKSQEPCHEEHLSRHLQMEVEAQEEEKARNFRAMRVNGRFRGKEDKPTPAVGSGRFAAPTGPPQQLKEKRPITVGVAPYITAEDRLAARKALQDRYKEKEKLAEQERQEKEAAEREAEEARLAEERRLHKFRARKAPDFANQKVFTPQKDTSWEPTRPEEFRLETDKRYGKVLREREQTEEGAYILSPNGTYDPLQVHLRQPHRPRSAAA